MRCPKNQHWVPRFYLQYFATPETYSTNEPKVWIFSKDAKDGDETLTNIKNVCAKRFLYSPIDQHGQRNWKIERKFSDLESLLARIWGQLSEDFVDLSDPSIRKALSLFIAVMYLRHPDTLKEEVNLYGKLVEFYKQGLLNTDEILLNESIEINGKWLDMHISDWEEYCAWEENDHQKFFINQVGHQAIFLARILMKKRWSVIFTESKQFITTDKPIIKQHKEKKIFGFGTPGVLVSFPLSQRRLLLMDDLHHEPANQYYPLRQGNLGAFNYNIWHNGSRFMISGRPIPEVLKEILSWGDAFKLQNA